MNRTAAALLTLAALGTGCMDDSGYGSYTGSVQAGELGVLALVNDRTTDLELLDIDCELRADAARNILAHRDGEDGAANTSDDDLFDDLAELDGVSRVGPSALGLLEDCADRLGFVPSEEDVLLINFVNDAALTTLPYLDDDCALRSDAARNLVAHRDGADGTPGTGDDDLFQSVGEIDDVSRVGAAAIALLRACADTTEPEGPWAPVPVSLTITANDPSVVYWEDDGVVSVDGDGAPAGTQLTVAFDGHELSYTRGPRFFNISRIARDVPEGYGADFLGVDGTVVSFQITQDPAGTITSAEALQVARDGLLTFMRDDRIHRADWQGENPMTWQEALDAGIMDGIDGFGDPSFDSAASLRRNTEEYLFIGSGPFNLYTEVRVNKSTGEASAFYVEID
jgi:hypothetical protein